ncbi:M23 family metallopeptidase [Rhizobium lemnae]|uniref:M23 family metallopeptidase n=1 Tax=Rhizobium lemnae TaxID=1214924 RepID=A0ABV8EG83_9HYPH|nr:M23 family metallopeptidase [Rhizobium lemnae]MCJ8510082.1 M23 family metallopeptidase [Rhizobium lemnae]
MVPPRNMVSSLGNEEPILADGRRSPDRREISLRWLSGTFLTGITSSVLMGVALFAALDGRQRLAIPAEAFASLPSHANDTVSRGKRLFVGNVIAMPTDRKVMEVSTMVKEGNREVVRKQPFSHVRMTLAANHVTQENYPSFDPLTIFSTGESQPDPGGASTGVIYGAQVESEISLQTVAFPTTKAPLDYAPGMTVDEVEENVRSNGSLLTDGSSQIAAMYYVDPQRFDGEDEDDVLSLGSQISARILEQNMTVSVPEPVTPKTRDYADDVIPIRRNTTIADALVAVGYPKEKSSEIGRELSSRLVSPNLEQGDVLRVGLIQEGEMVSVIRVSVYRQNVHLATIALDDRGTYKTGLEPSHLDAVDTAFSNDKPVILAGRDLPSVYDGIYKAALSYGMTQEMTSLMVKLLASTIDLQAQLKPSDTIEAFFSAANDKGAAGPKSELLYVNARFGDTTTRFYRFQNPDDNSVDYFDQDGKSIRQFLLRNPVPNGRLTSGFGMRRHPILGYSRMHTGTDWAASRGTPIIATGNGVVEKAGWASGYGNQTIIRHANGYETSYNHQSAIAKGVREGAKITQGQVIGYVGSTGSSTGAHLHYELIVNGTKVDAMKVRLPGGKSLSGTALAKFEDERKRIDALLASNTGEMVASR